MSSIMAYMCWMMVMDYVKYQCKAGEFKKRENWENPDSSIIFYMDAAWYFVRSGSGRISYDLRLPHVAACRSISQDRAPNAEALVAFEFASREAIANGNTSGSDEVGWPTGWEGNGRHINCWSTDESTAGHQPHISQFCLKHTCIISIQFHICIDR